MYRNHQRLGCESGSTPNEECFGGCCCRDIPPRFGMLLSRSLVAKFKGTLQLDFSYATILMFGQMRKLYREQKMKYMITSKEKPINHPINYVHTDLESFVLYYDSSNDIDSQLVEVDDILEIT